MNDEEKIREETEVLLRTVMQRYGDRLSPDMVKGVLGAVETVAKTVIPLRGVELSNHDDPFIRFVPMKMKKRG
jgi:hypothetical protein